MKQNRPSSGRSHAASSGFTLIELLVAITLATLLMVALAGVLSQVARRWRVVREMAPHSGWQQALHRQLQWDFEHSRKLGGDDNQLRLVGYAGRDFRTGVPTHRPTEVIYELVQQGETSWLMRTEVHLDADRLHAASAELVAQGIERLEVWQASAPDQQQRISKNLQATPAKLRVHFSMNATVSTGFEQWYVLE